MKKTYLKVLVLALLIFVFGISGLWGIDVTTVKDLWNVRNDMDGSYTQTGPIDLSKTNPGNITAWVPGTTYAVGDIVSHGDPAYAYYCDTGNSDTDFTPAKWTQMWEVSKGWEPIGSSTG